MALQSQQDLFEDTEVENIDPGEEREDNGDECGANRVDGVVIEGPVPNDYNPKTRRTVLWKDGETSIIINAMEDSLDLLIGHVKEHEYRRSRRNRWQTLLATVNGWNEDNGTGVIRSVASIRTRIHNLKTRSEYCYHVLLFLHRSRLNVRCRVRQKECLLLILLSPRSICVMRTMYETSLVGLRGSWKL